MVFLQLTVVDSLNRFRRSLVISIDDTIYILLTILNSMIVMFLLRIGTHSAYNIDTICIYINQINYTAYGLK